MGRNGQAGPQLFQPPRRSTAAQRVEAKKCAPLNQDTNEQRAESGCSGEPEDEQRSKDDERQLHTRRPPVGSRLPNQFRV